MNALIRLEKAGSCFNRVSDQEVFQGKFIWEMWDLFPYQTIMRTFAILIGAILIGAAIFVVWLGADYLTTGRTTEDTLTLLHCTGDRFAFIQGTYLYPVTEEAIEEERAAVIQRVKETGGLGPRGGGAGGGGGGGGSGGPGDPRIIAWGYCVDNDGVPSVFGYTLGNDGPAKTAIEESNRWYQDQIVNQSLDVNVTCSSSTVVERFRHSIWEMERVM